MSESIRELVLSASLPDDDLTMADMLTNSDGTYLFQEGECWDFKEAWPFSYSDDYFFGLARLVCAFSNTEGGIIVFGVDDQTRKGGKTKIIPNVDKFEQAFEQLTGKKPNIELKRYSNSVCGDADIMLVRKRDKYDPPLKFLRNVGNYRENTYWVRKGSTVSEAETADISKLFLETSLDSDQRQPAGQLPPTQSNIRHFVGRLTTIDSLFQWLASSDEPRAFLYGKGGSGKSTIAQELFKQIKINGGGYRIGRTDTIEQVIFLSAKKTFLNVESQRVESFVGNDFSSEEGLYSALLILGGAAPDNLETLTKEELKKLVQDFLRETSILLVIDDIDTLTTAGEDGGFDFLYRAVVRSDKTSKLLYTLRNRPTQSLMNSIEVPGMAGDELREFVEACVKQFRMPPPTKDFIVGDLVRVSEGRPLVIESIMLLRRQAGSYERALSMFERGSGDDVRSYVFEREWEAIPKNSRGKEILACLALYGRSMSFSDITAISRLEESQVRDAIASVQEMFLISDEDGEDTLFSLGSLTKSFIDTKIERLDMFDTIKARVENFKRSAYPESPMLARLNRELQSAEYQSRKGDYEAVDELIWKLNSDRYSPEISENPRFIEIKAYAGTLAKQPNLASVRHDFRSALQMGYRPPIEHIICWLRAEASSDAANKGTAEVYSLVSSDKRYSLSDRSEVSMERAVILYELAKRSMYTDPHRALDLLAESLDRHVEAYAGLVRAHSALSGRSEKLTSNTAFHFGQRAAKLDNGDRFLDCVLGYIRGGIVKLDPLVEPFVAYLQIQFRKSSHSRETLNRLLSKTELVAREIQKTGQFAWGDNKTAILDQIHQFRAAVKEKLTELRKASG